MTCRILVGDVRETLPRLDAGSVRCIVTSPPYWGLRDYGTATWEGGDDPACDHREVQAQNRPGRETPGGRGGTFPTTERAFKDECRRCGAVRVDSQLGLERTPEEYVANMVAVFREARRVLADDGALWLNLGDSYAANRSYQVRDSKHVDVGNDMSATVPPGLKPKDLAGIPWRVAFALQADGWYLRSDIVWSKPNPMPESVTDRPTKAHEYVFLLSKRERYFYDASAIAEPASFPDGPNAPDAIKSPHGQGFTRRARATDKQRGHGRRHAGFNDRWDAMERAEQCSGTRNARTVWTIATQPYPEAHFATFPEELARRCILAGSAPGDTVLDPFGGSGTVGAVAIGNGRKAVLCELNPKYADLAVQRVGPMYAAVEVA